MPNTQSGGAVGAPLIIGHRGAAAHAPENTLESFRLAFEDFKAGMIEFDVRLSRDQIPVVIHDATLDRTTKTPFVWGFGVEKDQRFTELLEKKLTNTEVLNLGCSGYGQDQELLLLKREGLRYAPDLIMVVIDAASDFENNSSFFQYGLYKPFFR